MTDIERHAYDVVVIGAGGAGLRAAIEAREQGLRTAIVCKSLFGKAHTVMAEGGIAASMGNVNAKDNWQVHFRDTMRGGKFLNNPRMAELHAKEAPERVWELETYGALFDRTPDGKISQRNFGGHEYPRLAHVGDRTGLELIRTLQQKIVSLQQDDQRELGDLDARIKVFAECTVTDLLRDSSTAARSPAPSATGASPAGSSLFEAPAVDPRDRRHRQVVQGHQQLVGVHRRRPRAGPAGRRDADQHGVRPVPPDRHGLAAVGQGHPGHRVGPRRRRRPDATARASGSCSTTSPTSSGRSTPTPRTRPTAGTRTRTTTGARPELLPRDEVARAINSEVKAGRGSPHGGVFLDVSTRLSADEIIKRLPSMHHQFKELADVDITAEPMEVGPTCHYVMGGVEVDADTQADPGPGPVRRR